MSKSKPKPLTEKEINRILNEKSQARKLASLPPEPPMNIYEFPSPAQPRSPIVDVATGRPFMEPVALAACFEHEKALRSFFDGLLFHYVEAIASGRIEAWRTCAHSVIDLMCVVRDCEVQPRRRA